MQINIYKKKHKKKKIRRVTSYAGNIKFGFYGFKIIENGIILSEEVEVIRRIIARITKRSSKIFIRIFFCQPITKKPLKSRMGKGVGPLLHYVSFIKKGLIFLEINYIPNNLRLLIYKMVINCFSLKLKFLCREVYQKTI